ncbi:NAD(P)-dependent oxidoreductase [Bacillus marinisedimentorum]|uniref:NAD(P)-dependent oxidoreductase n=1 Tax=Bacillus marinisedimentorum TaxID=1821260 RepID=UPI0007DFC991|nr:NAD(P)-dependent oxidoreductase [Bacillus marinisedimentorum]
MKIAFIGLGNMGLPMATNLVNAGYSVIGINRSKGKEQTFKERGGITGYTVSEAAAEADIVLTCLPLPEDVENVYFGQEGIIENARDGLTVADHSTVSPALNKKIADAAGKRGIGFIDAPISGGNFGAEAGTLSIMCGGGKETFDKLKDVFEVMGENIYHVGDTGSGSVVKLINNLMVSFHTQAVSEGMALAKEMNVNPDLVFDILNASYAQSRILERHYKNFIAKDHYEAGFAIKLLLKDMRIAGEMAKEAEMELPGGKSMTALLEEAAENGLGEKDMSAMLLNMDRHMNKK